VKIAYLVSGVRAASVQDVKMGDMYMGSWIVLSKDSYRRLRELRGQFLPVRQPEDFGRAPRADVTVFEIPESRAMRHDLRARRFVQSSLVQIERLAEQRRASVILLGGTSRPASSVLERSLSPVVIWGGGRASALLTSASTKTPGLVSMTDLAPTVLSHLGLKPPPEMSGRPIAMVSRPDSLGYVSRLDRETRFVYRLRFVLVPIYLVWVAASFVAASITLRSGRASSRLMRLCVTAALCWPLALLLLPLFRMGNTIGETILALALAMLLAWAAERRAETQQVLARIGLATGLAILADTLLGARLAARSVLGHDPILGQRFYGMGNEYMAALLGAWAVGLACSGAAFGERTGKMQQLILWAAVVGVIGAPWWGANLGGAMTAAAAVPIAVFSRGGRARAGHVLASLVCMAASAALLVWADMTRSPEAQTHIARAAEQVAHGGAAAAFTIAAGKIWQNIMQLGSVPLSLAMFCLYLVMFAALAWPRGVAAQLRERMPDSWRGIMAAAWGAIAACLANDSGVVAGGAALQWAVAGYLRLALSKGQPIEAAR
jgi:hypothetical protein